jgi:hypothetical protein
VTGISIVGAEIGVSLVGDKTGASVLPSVKVVKIVDQNCTRQKLVHNLLDGQNSNQH